MYNASIQNVQVISEKPKYRRSSRLNKQLIISYMYIFLLHVIYS